MTAQYSVIIINRKDKIMEMKINFLDNFKAPFLHVCFEKIPNTNKPVLQPNCIFKKKNGSPTLHMLHMTFDTLSQCHIYRNNAKISIVQLLCWCFTALWHILGHFGRGHLSYPHCSWASLLGSLQVLSAHSFANNWQLPFLNQQKGENGRKKNFMTDLHERMLPDVRIEPATVRIPGRRASDRIVAPGNIVQCSASFLFETVKQWACCWFSF